MIPKYIYSPNYPGPKSNPEADLGSGVTVQISWNSFVTHHLPKVVGLGVKEEIIGIELTDYGISVRIKQKK